VDGEMQEETNKVLEMQEVQEEVLHHIMEAHIQVEQEQQIKVMREVQLLDHQVTGVVPVEGEPGQSEVTQVLELFIQTVQVVKVVMV
tara:strand:- start:203 stop:463 length:261 start_codon:yes stop_codon:yes gene_type:complete